MSLQLLRCIEESEAKAEEIRLEAQRQARDMLKSVEEACTTHERDAAGQHRALSRRMLDDARAAMESRLTKAAIEQAADREKAMARAKQKLPDAVALLYERIVNHGDR